MAFNLLDVQNTANWVRRVHGFEQSSALALFGFSGFVVRPVNNTFPVAPAAELPKFMQFKSQGTNLGDRGVRVMDIVGDPERVKVTRGVGENSHVVTMRIIPPDVEPFYLGWMTDIHDVDSTPLAANTGSDEFGGPFWTSDDIYLGVVSYVSGDVEFSAVWMPVGSDPSPTTLEVAGGKLKVTLPLLSFPPATSEGLLVISATISGVPASNQIQVAIGAANYNTVTWGPVP